MYYVDTSVLMTYTLTRKREPERHQKVKQLFALADAGKLSLATSLYALIELYAVVLGKVSNLHAASEVAKEAITSIFRRKIILLPLPNRLDKSMYSRRLSALRDSADLSHVVSAIVNECQGLIAYDTHFQAIKEVILCQTPDEVITEIHIASAHGLEERACFMDNDLVEFAQKLPIHLKLGNLKKMIKMDENELRKLQKYYQQYDDGKNILRRAMGKILPKEIAQRAKQGFSAPDESWYRGANADYVKDTLLNKRAAYSDFIQPSYVEKIIDEHCNKGVNHRLLIWSFLCFEHWLRIFMKSNS